MALNKKYSYKDFTGQDFSNVPASEFNNSEIVGSCFFQRKAINTDVFPVGMIGVTFSKCNLNNVLVSIGNTIDKGCHENIAIQNDGVWWKVDSFLKPIEPLSTRKFIKLGISTDPKDIPLTKLETNVFTEKIAAQRQTDKDALWAFDPALAERLGI